MKSEVVVLDESFLNTCWFCGGKMKSKGVYDYYCSKKCEEDDEKRIQIAVNEGKHPVEILSENLAKVVRKK